MKSYFSNSIKEKLRPGEAELTESARSHRVRLVSVSGTPGLISVIPSWEWEAGVHCRGLGGSVRINR